MTEGRSRDQTLRVTLAQTDCALGDVAENLQQVREALREAAVEAADLVVFPELTLTGYSLGQVSDDVSRAVSDDEIVGLAKLTGDVSCVVGFAEAGRVHTYNSAAYLEAGEVLHVHRKLYLPTYDIWEERKHFTPGDAMRAFDTRRGQFAILICSDAWQPALAVLAVQDGARVLIVPANSTGRRSNIESEWRDINRFYARLLECYVVFVNRVGEEGPLSFWGGSHVYDPWGELVAEAPLDEPAHVTVELDLANVRRRRREMPLVKEARLALLNRELGRLVAEGGDL
ncbi:MAG: nitrilase-related carbon-nitrogen hydrolase [Thermoleophilaceae bacterium]